LGGVERGGLERGVWWEVGGGGRWEVVVVVVGDG